MIYRHIASVFIAIVMSAHADAANNLQDIQFAELPDNRVEIRTTFSGAVEAVPSVYAIETPARIVFDFPGVNSTLEQKKYMLALGNLTSAVILTTKEKTRIVFSLSSPASYRYTIKGNQLVTIIDNSVAAAKTYNRLQNKSLSGSPHSASAINAISNIDFKRAQGNAGQLLLTLSNPGIAVNVERNADSIHMVFPETTITEALQRRLDVIDFATPVQFIETRLQGNSVSISVETNGQYEYLAYQTDGTYVVNITPLSPEQIKEQEQQFKYVGEKLSLNFQDIEVRKVLEIIADFTDLNLVASDTVSGNITLRLENVPWDQALDLVLKSKSLDKRQSGSVLLVAPAAEIAERERQELETRRQLQELEPLVTEFLQIRYADAANILTLISGSKETSGSASGTRAVLSSRGSAAVDERTNAIILTDITANINKIKQLIEKIDVPVRQVMIEARIVSANDTFREELGFSFSGEDPASNGAGVDNFGGEFSTTTQSPDSLGSFALSYLPGDMNLSLEIQALEKAGYGEIISQPRILTGDKQTAKISSGQQVPFTSRDGTTVKTIFKDALLSLEVTPKITPDNRLILALKVNRDSLDKETQTNDGNPINVTELTTTALVGDGDTLVLGGIFEQDKSTAESKVPLLSDIPVIGRLFRSTIDVDNKRELLIFITPRILTDIVLDQ